MKTINLKEPLWVIGDVHGQLDALKNILSKIPENAKICFVGDLIDRGYQSKEVVSLVKNREYFCVRGNHEEFMIDFDNTHSYPIWIRNGGVETIHSYIELTKEILKKGFSGNSDITDSLNKNKEFLNHVKWMRELPVIIKFNIENEKPLYVSHSGLRLFETDTEILENNSEHEIVWNRSMKNEVDFAVNIHGHSIVPKDMIFVSKSQIDIDTGAFLDNMYLRAGKAILTAIEYPSLKIIHSNLIS